ncbi:MAG TPA: hypothetical protein VGB45_03090 [Abditibacterium sp.]|jgi:hypothetical protein
MKLPKFEPISLSIFGVLIAPAVCGFNAAIVGIFTGQVRWTDAPFSFLLVSALALLVCFPLALWSEKICELWQSRQTVRARRLSAGGGLIGLFCLLSFFPDFKFDVSLQNAYIVAGCLLPVLWSLMFLLFALFTRPRKI